MLFSFLGFHSHAPATAAKEEEKRERVNMIHSRHHTTHRVATIEMEWGAQWVGNVWPIANIAITFALPRPTCLTLPKTKNNKKKKTTFTSFLHIGRRSERPPVPRVAMTSMNKRGKPNKPKASIQVFGKIAKYLKHSSPREKNYVTAQLLI